MSQSNDYICCKRHGLYLLETQCPNRFMEELCMPWRLMMRTNISKMLAA